MTNKPLEEKQLVLCTVEKIIGTTVFVKIEEYNIRGTISFPEVAPGRIRNIREYAFPGKKIVCKTLKVYSDHAELSLRRVKNNEKNDFNESNKKEKSYHSMLKSNLGEKADKIILQIKEKENSLVEFIDKARENRKILEEYFSKEEIEKLGKILAEKKAKEIVISRQFSLSTKASNGIIIIKDILKQSSKDINGIEFNYLAAGKYMAKLKSKDPKQAQQQLTKVIILLEDLAKKNNCQFDFKKD